MASGNITPELLARYKATFDSDQKNHLAQSFVTQHGIRSGCRSTSYLPSKVNNSFNTKVTDKFPHAGPVTDQKGTGRCWMFAILNVIRLPFIEKYKLGEFEFSQAYLFFWDKIERANYFLHAYIETRSEDIESRLCSWLVQDPFSDGGQWDMLVNLVTKYGLVPKEVYPETKSLDNSRTFNSLITNKLREYCCTLRKLAAEGKTEDQLHVEREKMLEEIYRICCITMNPPPAEFDWEYTDKNGQAHSVKGISPLQFYTEHVKPVFNMEDKICLINDPRPNHPYMKLYTLKYLGNMKDGYPVRYINVPVDMLKDCVAKSIKNKEAVWFGCDVGKMFDRQCGSLSLECLHYELTFGLSVMNMDKAERLRFGESMMTHAMSITGMHIENVEDKEKYVRYQIENSWGSNSGKKGYLVMTDSWFSEFVYEVVVDKSHVAEDVVEVLKQEAVVLPPWDPMGALARAD